MCKRYTKDLFCAALAVASVFCLGTAVLAAETDCTTTMTGGTVHGNLNVPDGATCTLNGVTVTGNVSVGHGSTLFTMAAMITRNVHAHSPAALRLVEDSSGNGTVVGGNVQSHGSGDLNLFGVHVGRDVLIEDAKSVLLIAGSTVGGNVEIHRTAGGVPPLPPGRFSQSSICNNILISGDLQLVDNHGPFVIGTLGPSQCGTQRPGSNGGSLIGGDLVVNANSALVTIDNNDIEHNLVCDGNSPVPTSIKGNDVGGKERGQCAIFTNTQSSDIN